MVCESSWAKLREQHRNDAARILHTFPVQSRAVSCFVHAGSHNGRAPDKVKKWRISAVFGGAAGGDRNHDLSLTKVVIVFGNRLTPL
jgi:hypothetical protein